MTTPIRPAPVPVHFASSDARAWDALSEEERIKLLTRAGVPSPEHWAVFNWRGLQAELGATALAKLKVYLTPRSGGGTW